LSAVLQVGFLELQTKNRRGGYCGFWSELGNLVVAVADVVTGTDDIKKWLEMPLNEAEEAVKYFVDTGSKSEIELVYEGFVLMCTNSHSIEETKPLLELFGFYVMYREQHRGRLYLSNSV